MKHIFAVITAAVLLFYCSITVFSFEIDGVDNGSEWIDTKTAVLVDGESNCKVTFGLVKWSVDNESNSLYLCFKFIEPDIASENANVGISLSVENSEPFIITASNSLNSYDTDKYSLNGAVSIDENEGATCEIRLGIKHGIPLTTKLKVRFIDSDAVKSNVYDLTIETVKPTEVTESTTEKEKTTKNNYDDIFDIINTKTTAKPKKTTTVKTDKTSNTSSKTTKIKTTKEKSTQKHISESSKTEKPVISEEPTQNITEVSNAVIENETYANEKHSSVLSTTDGQKYKTITAIAGGSILLLVAVLGSIKFGKKTPEEENDPKS